MIKSITNSAMETFVNETTTIPSTTETTKTHGFNVSQKNEFFYEKFSSSWPTIEALFVPSTTVPSTSAAAIVTAATKHTTSTLLSTGAHTALATTWTDWLSSGRVQIPLYATILLLAIVGNALVIMTLVQNRRMRTITNVFLLNLAFSDILLGVLCMPFTLVGTLLRDFVFGEIMCKFLPYLQGKPNYITEFRAYCVLFMFIPRFKIKVKLFR